MGGAERPWRWAVRLLVGSRGMSIPWGLLSLLKKNFFYWFPERGGALSSGTASFLSLQSGSADSLKQDRTLKNSRVSWKRANACWWADHPHSFTSQSLLTLITFGNISA